MPGWDLVVTPGIRPYARCQLDPGVLLASGAKPLMPDATMALSASSQAPGLFDTNARSNTV